MNDFETVNSDKKVQYTGNLLVNIASIYLCIRRQKGHLREWLMPECCRPIH